MILIIKHNHNIIHSLDLNAFDVNCIKKMNYKCTIKAVNTAYNNYQIAPIMALFQIERHYITH